MVVPYSGTHIRIKSYKHDDSLHRIWHDSLVLDASDNVCIAANNQTLVTEHDGQSWTTGDPAICYFYTDYWFNVIGIIKDDGIYYYCNISSPFTYDANIGVIRYIDYDLDVKVYPDMTYDLLDEGEFELHKRKWGYSKELAGTLKRNLDFLLSWVRQRKGPFSSEHVYKWYERFVADY